MHGMNGQCSPEEKKQAFKDLLGQVRSLMAMSGVGEGGEEKDEFLDPESLMAAKHEDAGDGQAPAKDSKDAAMEATELAEDDMQKDLDNDGDFDPSEVAEYFGKRSDMPSKPLKSARFSMVAESAPMKFGKKKV